MAKEPISGWIHEPLAAVLGTRAKVAVLRVLWRATTPLVYREVVRRSGMAYRSVDLALGELIASGIVELLQGGRERRVRLRTAHRLAAAISNLMQVDADFFAALRVELRAAAVASERDGLRGAAIVGAVARRQERLGGELELLLIATDRDAAVRCHLRFAAASEGIGIRFGVRLKVIAYDLATARAMWRTLTAAAMRDVRDAELLTGSTPAELLSAPG